MLEFKMFNSELATNLLGDKELIRPCFLVAAHRITSVSHKHSFTKRDLILKYGFTLIPVEISDYTHYRVDVNMKLAKPAVI